MTNRVPWVRRIVPLRPGTVDQLVLEGRATEARGDLLDLANELGPGELRSLDAIHLAAALSIGSDLGVLLTYDERLARAATAQGLEVESPGR